ncbi:Uncharacterised protein [uncultured archaeon]|nr:Uncharacterised protein [uncultured archaeon]
MIPWLDIMRHPPASVRYHLSPFEHVQHSDHPILRERQHRLGRRPHDRIELDPVRLDRLGGSGR